MKRVAISNKNISDHSLFCSIITFIVRWHRRIATSDRWEVASRGWMRPADNVGPQWHRTQRFISSSVCFATRTRTFLPLTDLSSRARQDSWIKNGGRRRKACDQTTEPQVGIYAAFVDVDHARWRQTHYRYQSEQAVLWILDLLVSGRVCKTNQCIFSKCGA